jgi:hypothetical protein
MKPSEILFPSTRGRFGMFDSVEIIRASELPHVHDWRGIDTGRMCATCGTIEKQGPEFGSRAMYDDLLARVDNALALRSSSVDKNEPWVILANARGHLADQMTKATDDQIADLSITHHEMGRIQECLILNQVRICRNCKQMEGLHWAFGYCRIQPNHGDQRLSLRFEAE